MKLNRISANTINSDIVRDVNYMGTGTPVPVIDMNDGIYTKNITVVTTRQTNSFFFGSIGLNGGAPTSINPIGDLLKIKADDTKHTYFDINLVIAARADGNPGWNETVPNEDNLLYNDEIAPISKYSTRLSCVMPRGHTTNTNAIFGQQALTTNRYTNPEHIKYKHRGIWVHDNPEFGFQTTLSTARNEQAFNQGIISGQEIEHFAKYFTTRLQAVYDQSTEMITLTFNDYISDISEIDSTGTRNENPYAKPPGLVIPDYMYYDITAVCNNGGNIIHHLFIAADITITRLD